MAKTIIKLTTILSFLILLALHSQTAFSTEDAEDHEGEDYELDDGTHLPEYFGFRSRFLASIAKQRARCSTNANNICNGVSANKGAEMLFCCKKKCVNVLGDMYHCGQCGKKCRIGERCCNGVCTNVMNNRNNCGKCSKKCKTGLSCEYGFCGYA